ncbi:hypothetical protein [Actinosynnema sp. NPDC020468]|uniref:hypothetical protein n=1 Tax=Actinosynnema sp. NPDC020468 TaxID=3154488 RepID=UPI0033CC5A46
MKLGKVLGVVFAAVFAVGMASGPASAAGEHWECKRVPAGWTYTMVRADQGCEPLYYVRLPEAGLWACTVPAGWTYTATKIDYSCGLGATSTKYLLAAV